jgi:hypothetical protein
MNNIFFLLLAAIGIALYVDALINVIKKIKAIKPPKEQNDEWSVATEADKSSEAGITTPSTSTTAINSKDNE